LRNNTTYSSKYIHFQIGTITVKNSNAGSSATALIDLGGSYLHVKGNTSGQKATLNIDVDTAVNSTYSAGATIALRINQNGTLNIAAGKTLTVNPKMSVGGGSYTGALNLGSGSTLTINDALFFYQNSAISMGSGSAINGTGSISFAAAGSYDLSGAISTTGAISVSSGAAVTSSGAFVGGNLTVDGAGSSFIREGDFARNGKGAEATNGGAIVVTGNYSHIPGNDAKISLKTGGTMTVNSISLLNNTFIEDEGSMLWIKNDTTTNRIVQIKNNGVMQIDGDYTIRNDGNRTDFSSSAATVITVQSGGKIIADSILLSTAKLNLQSANAFENSSGNAISLTTDSASAKSLLQMSANQAFDTITANTINLELVISNDAVLTADFASLNDGMVFVNGFAEHTIFVSNYEDIADANSVFFAYATKDDEGTLIDALYFDNGWLSAIAPVPEPATWAALLGAITLGFAAYRRRK